MPALIVVIFILLAVGIAYVSWYVRDQRRKAFAVVAARLGFRYSPDDPFDLVSIPFALFSKGDGQGTENVLWGTHQGREIRVFDFWYFEESTDSEGHSSRTYNRFSCGLTSIQARCPHLQLGPEGFLSRLADHVGFRDIEFESEEFNRRFQISSEDRKFAYALIDPRMMEWLLGAEELGYEVLDTFVLCSTGRLKPEEAPTLLTAIEEFCGHIPAVVSDLYPTGRSLETS